MTDARRVALILVVAAIAMGVVRPKADATETVATVRFHHLHYRVGDPAGAMNHVAQALGGTRVLLPGLGVGVQIDDTYTLFDRLDGAEPASIAAEDAFRRARGWLEARGITGPGDFMGERVAALLPGEYVDHVGFAAADFDAVRTGLTGAGARPARETEDAVLFDVGGGLGVEIVRERDRADTHWCPMHPDVRAPEEGATCPICSMDLVPIPPPRIGEYLMDVEVRAAPSGKGAAGLRLIIRDPHSKELVPSFAIVHERPFHLFIVDRTLEYFEHVHPDPAGEGTFELRHEIPPGEYMLIADFLPHGGTTQTVQRAIVTPGHTAPLMPKAPPVVAGPRERVVNGIRFTLDVEDIRARRQGKMRVTMADATRGTPVSDLEPYLGAAAHLLIVNTELTDAVHGHPLEPATRGPIVTFEPLFPVAGTYKLWIQVQRGGEVVTAPFVVEVRER